MLTVSSLFLLRVGGVTNGNDLVAAYARQKSQYFAGPLVELALILTDVGDRPQEYTTGKTVFTIGVIWQILKAAVMGFGRKTKTS